MATGAPERPIEPAVPLVEDPTVVPLPLDAPAAPTPLPARCAKTGDVTKRAATTNAILFAGMIDLLVMEIIKMARLGSIRRAMSDFGR